MRLCAEKLGFRNSAAVIRTGSEVLAASSWVPSECDRMNASLPDIQMLLLQSTKDSNHQRVNYKQQQLQELEGGHLIATKGQPEDQGRTLS